MEDVACSFNTSPVEGGLEVAHDVLGLREMEIADHHHKYRCACRGEQDQLLEVSVVHCHTVDWTRHQEGSERHE